MTPYRVVVCEDDAQLGEDLARRCREIFAGWRVEAEVRLFASADALGKEQTCSSFKNVGTAGAVVTSCACGKHHRRRCAGESHQGRGALRDHYLAVFPLDVKSQGFAEGADWGVDGAVSVLCGDVEDFAEGDELDLGDAWRWVVFASGFDGGDVFIDFGEEI